MILKFKVTEYMAVQKLINKYNGYVQVRTIIRVCAYTTLFTTLFSMVVGVSSR